MSDPPAKRPRSETPLLDIELRARLDLALRDARPALVSVAAHQKNGKLVVPVLRQLRHMRVMGRMAAWIDLAQEEVALPDVLVMMEGKTFPILSSAIAGGIVRRALVDRAEEHWNLCITSEQQAHLVGFMEEFANAFKRVDGMCARHTAICRRAAVLFEVDVETITAETTRLPLSDLWAKRLMRFNDLAVDFSSNLAAQEDAIAFLEVTARLSQHADAPLPPLAT